MADTVRQIRSGDGTLHDVEDTTARQAVDDLKNTGVSVTWNGIEDKPSSFPPSEHNHDTLYVKAAEPAEELPSEQTELDAKLASFLSAVYPVGSIYISVNSTDPGTLFGGGWKKVGSGKCLQGADDSHAAGTTIEAGLPNITGSEMLSWGDSSGGGIIMHAGHESGALYSTKDNAVKSFYYSNPIQSDYPQHHNTINIDASRSNSIYGKSTTVQPPSFVVNIWQRIS